MCWNYVIEFLMLPGTIVKRLSQVSEEILVFGLLNNVETLKDYRTLNWSEYSLHYAIAASL